MIAKDAISSRCQEFERKYLKRLRSHTLLREREREREVCKKRQ